jgi:hypothetical protein
LGGLVAITDTAADPVDPKDYRTLQQDSIKKLVGPAHQLSYRFELVVPRKRCNGLLLMIRALPANSSFLNDSERLSGPDVASMMVAAVPVASYTFPSSCKDFERLYPCGIQVFSSHQLTMSEYRSILIVGMPPLMTKFRILNNIEHEAASKSLYDPKMKTGNSLRFPEVARIQQQKRKLEEPDLDQTTGSYTFSKYGPTFKLWDFAPRVPRYIRKFLGMGLASSTWKCYRTGWL